MLRHLAGDVRALEELESLLVGGWPHFADHSESAAILDIVHCCRRFGRGPAAAYARAEALIAGDEAKLQVLRLFRASSPAAGSRHLLSRCLDLAGELGGEACRAALLCAAGRRENDDGDLRDAYDLFDEAAALYRQLSARDAGYEVQFRQTAQIAISFAALVEVEPGVLAASLNERAPAGLHAA
jgi:hypothetical protein